MFGAFGFFSAAGLSAAFLFGGCHKSNDETAPGAGSVESRTESGAPGPSQSGATGPQASASGSAHASGEPSDAGAPVADDKPYDGPMLGAMAFQTPIYPETRFSDERLGYIRQGGKVPVDPKPIHKSNCKEGWYHLVDGGFVCGKYASLDLEQPRIRLGVKAPDLEAILPYKYAYNRFHGTPLYKALPTRDEMLKYEPYLLEDKKKDKEKADEKSGGAGGASAEGDHKSAKHMAEEGGATPSGDEKTAKETVAAVSAFDAGTPESPEEAAAAPPKPWWQTDEKKPNVTLADLEQDSDGNLSKRMVKGFFIAVDKSFGWNDRSWYRTTNGLVAPTDRMWINKPPESHGIDIPEGVKTVAFVLGEKAQKYDLGKDGKKAKESGKLARFTGVLLTGKTVQIDDNLFRESTDGYWVKDANVTLTAPGPRPSEVGEHEKWVDVNLDKKTMVLLEGDRPVYATLVSPGKKSRDKKKNHATPTGSWRIREKHIAVTMDGDGAAGDLPYSIEDVPYVEYFKGSYALHGAFWHSNFGHDMSHGCVNLSPLDAKHVFNWTEPHLPRGWHAVWSTKDHPGTMVVIHGDGA